MLQGPLIGNAVLTLAYLLTGSSLAPIGGHVAMHIAAVLHGPGSAIQLPPHYYLSFAQTDDHAGRGEQELEGR
jgi:hypothetical protein